MARRLTDSEGWTARVNRGRWLKERAETGEPRTIRSSQASQPSRPAWFCHTCGTGHYNERLARCRICRTLRYPAASPTPAASPWSQASWASGHGESSPQGSTRKKGSKGTYQRCAELEAIRQEVLSTRKAASTVDADAGRDSAADADMDEATAASPPDRHPDGGGSQSAAAAAMPCGTDGGDARPSSDEVKLQSAIASLHGVPGCEEQVKSLRAKLAHVIAAKPHARTARQVFTAAEVELERAAARKQAASKRLEETQALLERHTLELREAAEEWEVATAVRASALAALTPAAAGDGGSQEPPTQGAAAGPDMSKLKKLYDVVGGGQQTIVDHYKRDYDNHVAEALRQGGSPQDQADWLWRQLAMALGDAIASSQAKRAAPAGPSSQPARSTGEADQKKQRTD